MTLMNKECEVHLVCVKHFKGPFSHNWPLKNMRWMEFLDSMVKMHHATVCQGKTHFGTALVRKH